MTRECRTLVLYRIERAREALDEAAILLEKGHRFVDTIEKLIKKELSGLI